ncbi:MAG: hypothetical protein ABJA70_07965 [Chryseolinea sp.]
MKSVPFPFFLRLFFLITLHGNLVFSQTPQFCLVKGDGVSGQSIIKAKPLDKLSVLNANGKNLTVADGEGRIYVNTRVQPILNFIVSGTLGKHTLQVVNKKGNKTDELQFDVNAITNIDDGGRYTEMFNVFYKSMRTDTGSVKWNGTKYRYFVPWGLDHCHTMKGLKYFYGFGNEFVDLMHGAQREDGMIWSFVEHMSNMDYFKTRDSVMGYTRKIGNKYFVRQPTENHPEYIYVKTIYQVWQASGDDAWMKTILSSAARALDYAQNDPARWSERFQLLKRVYTIDSWDFQVDDEYTPNIGLTNTMIIDPVKSKFGVFFGDNTGYVMACHELAEMYDYAGMKTESTKYLQRALEIDKRLNALSWNGKFYTHFIDEDSNVKRNLGVDEKSQLAQSNAYTLNRGLDHEKSKAIIESYINLKNNLPVGSPGEWYAIYPPFERGFGGHGDKWQYMNGGVGGHVAGELARGAFENGYEKYGADILERLFELGKKHNNKIYFSYTGSIPPTHATPNYKSLNIKPFANMDTWDKGGKKAMPWMNSSRAGDDFRKLPVGNQIFASIPFDVIDPGKNNRNAVVAVSKRKGYQNNVEIPVNEKTACVYFLHTSSKPSSENVSGAVSFVYGDGSKSTSYILMGKQLTYWWFSQLKTDYSGIAWYGSNEVSKGIGISWCAIENPHPEKVISKIILHSAEDETIYTVFSITLSDQPHYVPIDPVSYGGPDNWAAATAMAAMVEGLAGVKNSPHTQAFHEPTLSPRWNETKTDTVNVAIRFAASKGYVAYAYINQTDQNQIEITVTGSGEKINCHLLLPENKKVKSVLVDGKEIISSTSTVEQSTYVDFVLSGTSAKQITMKYR